MVCPVRTATDNKQLEPVTPRVIAISSGKGGVGKSSIAVNLGISLSKQGHKVCVLDADTGLANVNILLGVQPQFSLEHVLYGAKTIDEIMLSAPFGMKVIPGANGISETVSLHPRQQLRLTRELSRIEQEFDYLLIDTAAGIADTTLDFICASHYALVVITPEPTSLTDAFSLIKLLKRKRGNIRFQVVVNMCAGANDGQEIFARFASAVKKYIGVDLTYLGYLPRDESVRAAVSLQNPVAMFPDTDPSSRSFLRLADAVIKHSRPEAGDKSFSAYWYRQFKHAEQQLAAASKPAEAKESASSPKDSAQENNYLAELRSRLLLMIEKGTADRALIAQMLQEGVLAYMQAYDHSPLDAVGFIENVILSPNRDDHQLREIFSKVKPWGEVKATEAVTEKLAEPAAPVKTPDTGSQMLNAVSSKESKVKAAGGKTLIEVELITSTGAAYDKNRFGTQEALVEQIRHQHGKENSLMAILEAYMAGS